MQHELFAATNLVVKIVLHRNVERLPDDVNLQMRHTSGVVLVKNRPVRVNAGSGNGFARRVSAMHVRNRSTVVRSPTAISQASHTFVVPGLLAFGLAILLLFNTLTDVGEDAEWLGRIGIVVTLAIPAIVQFALMGSGHQLPRWLRGPIICFGALCWLHVPRNEEDFSGWIPMIQLVLLGGFFMATVSWQWPADSLRIVKRISQCSLLITLVSWVWHDHPTPYAGWYENTNTHGALLAMCFGLSMLWTPPAHSLTNRAIFAAWSILATAIVCLTASRAAVIAILAGAAVYILWPWLERRRWRFMTAFLAVLGAIGIFTVAQSTLVTQMQERGYNDLSYEFTGKNVGTRTIVWDVIGAAVFEQPFLGHGADTRASEILGMQLSAHSLYLQLALQVGLLGVLLLLLLFCQIWNVMWLGRRDPVVRSAGAVFIGIVLHQAFEVSLTQNNLAIGVMMWLSVAIGVSRSLKSSGYERSVRQPMRTKYVVRNGNTRGLATMPTR